jgi:endonuclease YncB( thermonuclease family)
MSTGRRLGPAGASAARVPPRVAPRPAGSRLKIAPVAADCLHVSCRLLVVVLALTGLAILPAAAGAASRGPCVPGTPGPTCEFWTARTTFVADGDTIRVRIDGDRSRRVQTIRFTGINAMELHRYSSDPRKRRGECHGVEATNIVDRMIARSHGRVRLAAQSSASTTGGRLRRSVFVRSGGRWVDLGRVLMERGLALWLPNPVEYAHNLEYRTLAQQAARAHRGLYDPAACGAGPDQDLPIELLVKWDADGNDTQNVNGEWVDIRNDGTRDLPIAGWWFRDSWLEYNRNHIPGFEFPAYARVPAGGSIRLHMGCGPNSAATPNVFYWCRPRPVFENAGDQRTQIGDGGYLFDRQGDLRASMIYPCAVACTDALAGRLQLVAHATMPESIDITNVSGAPADLDRHVLVLHMRSRAASILTYPFLGPTVLLPGQTLQLLTAGAPADDQPLVRHIPGNGALLADTGNAVSLETYDDALGTCAAWGIGRCQAG